MTEQDAVRVQLGAILADAAGDDPDVGALLAFMTAANPAEPDEEILARYILGRLAAQGWQITRGGDPEPRPENRDPWEAPAAGAVSDYENDHRIALARELTYAAGVPLRDRYGFAASDEAVLFAVNACFTHAGDEEAADAIGLAVFAGDVALASGYDMATDEVYERAIVAALRPLVTDRRAAEARSHQP
jgi:hypothetical protein